MTDDGMYVWGVDVSTKRVAIAFNGPTLDARTVEFPAGHTTGARLDAIYLETALAARLWGAEFPPYFVWVEQPTGTFTPPQLLYATGVVQAALYHALERQFAFPVEVRTVSVGEWKKRSVGHGNASKDQVFVWAREQGYAGESQDEADAWGVAWAGARLLGLGPAGQPMEETA